MLGINSPREPITPEFSKEIRAALWRATTGNLNEEEKAACRRSREVRKKWKVVWETKQHHSYRSCELNHYADRFKEQFRQHVGKRIDD